MLCIGTVDAASGRIEFADGGAPRVEKMARILLRKLRAAGGREVTTEMACDLLSSSPREEVTRVLDSLYLSGLVSVRRADERHFNPGSRIIRRCYWRAREPRTRPRRKGVGA